MRRLMIIQHTCSHAQTWLLAPRRLMIIQHTHTDNTHTHNTHNTHTHTTHTHTQTNGWYIELEYDLLSFVDTFFFELFYDFIPARPTIPSREVDTSAGCGSEGRTRYATNVATLP